MRKTLPDRAHPRGLPMPTMCTTQSPPSPAGQAATEGPIQERGQSPRGQSLPHSLASGQCCMGQAFNLWPLGTLLTHHDHKPRSSGPCYSSGQAVSQGHSKSNLTQRLREQRGRYHMQAERPSLFTCSHLPWDICRPT